MGIKLTARQCECLILLARGLTSQDVADEMYVSKRTVDYHLREAYERLKVKNRIQAISKARQLQLIPGAA